MGGSIILDNEDAALLDTDSRRILDSASKCDELGAGLAFVRNRRSYQEWCDYLRANGALNRARNPKRWCSAT
jgi:hypothetical protein